MDESTDSDRDLVGRVRALPDLHAQARSLFDAARPERHVYVIQDELAAREAKAGRAHVLMMPYRSPPRPCSTGAHEVPMLEHTVVIPLLGAAVGREAKLVLWEETLHEVEAHGAALAAEQRELLRQLPRPARETPVVLEGTLHKRMTVGYLSPYYLRGREGDEVELRAAGKSQRDLLERLVGKRVRVEGTRVETAPRNAEPGSEAATRFLGGVIPAMGWVEIRRLHDLNGDRE